MTTMSEQPRQQKLLRDELERLVMLLTECSTQLEDAAYERELQRLTREAIDDGDDTEIEAALSRAQIRAALGLRPASYLCRGIRAEHRHRRGGEHALHRPASGLEPLPQTSAAKSPPRPASRVAQSFKRLMTSGKDDVVVRIGNVLLAPRAHSGDAHRNAHGARAPHRLA